MRSYRDISIRYKLQGMVIVTCTVVLFVASAAFTVYEVFAIYDRDPTQAEFCPAPVQRGGSAFASLQVLIHCFSRRHIPYGVMQSGETIDNQSLSDEQKDRHFNNDQFTRL
jgi:hypothetical protein